jgi:hypothetical protein
MNESFILHYGDVEGSNKATKLFIIMDSGWSLFGYKGHPDPNKLLSNSVFKALEIIFIGNILS